MKNDKIEQFRRVSLLVNNPAQYRRLWDYADHQENSEELWTILDDIMVRKNGFKRFIAFYVDPMSGYWLLEDNSYVDSEYLDVDTSACFEDQYWDACEIVGVIMQERGIEAFSISQCGQAWIVTPVENVELVRDDSENDDDDDFVWLQ